MLTYVIKDDNSITRTVSAVIMQKSNIEKMHILTPRFYKDVDMTDFTVTMEYILPSKKASRAYDILSLTVNDIDYEQSGYLEYVVPLGIDLTAEDGEIDFQLTWTKLGIDPNTGNTIQYVRKSLANTIRITPITVWSDIIPDSKFTDLDQRILKLDAIAKQIGEFQTQMDAKIPTDIVLNTEDNDIKLKTDVQTVGNGIKVVDLSKAVKDCIYGEDIDTVEDGVNDIDNSKSQNLDEMI